MPDYTVTAVKLRLEYTMKTGNLELHRDYAIADFVPTDQAGMAAADGQAILGLQSTKIANKPCYVLFRLQDDPDTIFAFDTDPGLKVAEAALKVSVTLTAANEDTPITSSYPILRQNDNPCPQLPDGVKWKFLLKREDGGQPKYRLMYDAPPGGESSPKCVALECYTTKKLRTKMRCALAGCYTIQL